MKLLTSIAMLFFCSYNALLGQDTTPPVITMQPTGQSYTCETDNIVELLTTWFNNNGGTQATDDSGTVMINAPLTLNEAINAFLMSEDTLCGTTKNITIQFEATDEAGNLTLTNPASFNTYDNIPPTILVPPPAIVSNCFPGIQDSLESWINNYGYMIAIDNCDGVVGGDLFFWNIQGMSGGNTSTIGVGPYPQVPDGTCEFQVNITFQRKDGCGNTKSENTSFTVIDTIAPTLSYYPPDTTVSCDKIYPADTIIFMDNCDSSPEFDLSESSTQDMDESSCNHYNYDITRTWNVVDKCGNTTNHTQVIHVEDIQAPIFSALDTIIVDCNSFSTFDPNYFFEFYADNCSNVFFNYTDFGQPNMCNSELDRSYNIYDICNNSFVFTQHIKVGDYVGPTFDSEPGDLEFYCDSGLNFQGEYFDWIDELNDITVSDSCSHAQKFVALPGTYTLGDSTTYPGVFPTNFPDLNCDIQSEYLVYQDLDLVAYDACGNTTVNKIHFGIKDTLAPIITGCVDTVSINSNSGQCQGFYTIPELTLSDNCSELFSPVIKTKTVPIHSDLPGDNELPVNTVYINIGPYFSSGLTPNGFIDLTLEFNNLDADDATEYFLIYDEYGQYMGTTPHTSTQCGDTTIVFNTFNTTILSNWLSDGYVSFSLVPNVPPDFGSLAINDVCTNSFVKATLAFEAEIETHITGNVVFKNDTLDYDDALNKIYKLDIGNNDFEYFFSDCAGNQSSCHHTVVLSDDEAPIITCPPSILDTIEQNCSKFLDLPSGYSVSENCKLSRIYNEESPLGMGKYLNFVLDDNSGEYLAASKNIIFNNVFEIKKSTNDPVVSLVAKGDFDEPGESIKILGEDGLSLGSTFPTGENCGFVYLEMSIPIAKFNAWVQDGLLELVAEFPNDANIEGNGVNPCQALVPGSTIDSVSFITLTLNYDDAQAYYTTSGALNTPLTTINPDIDSLSFELPAGITTVTYYVSDAGQNSSSCSYEIEIVDITPPTALCKNNIVEVPPSGLDDLYLTQDIVDDGSTDNCGIYQYSLSQDTIRCSDIGTQLNVILTVTDSSGNSSSCESLIKVERYTLQPSYNAGICPGDSLQLFANLPMQSPDAVFTFEWYMNDVLFSNEENPVINNFAGGADISFHVIATGFNGCYGEGTILVNFQPLSSPTLDLESTSGCKGDSIRLASTSYAGNINYSWYEGSFPNGNLITQTANPILTVSSDNAGTRYFYLIAESEECTSLASNSVAYTTFEKPIAAVDDPFITVCEGGEITLSTQSEGQNYKYQWFGPGVMSTMKNPPSITDVTQSNEGSYSLVLNVGQCYSDTATVIVDVLERPDQPILSGEEIFCDGSNFSIQVSNNPNADAYEWYIDSVLFKVTTSNILSQAASDAFEGEWTVIIREGDCNSIPSEGKDILIEERIEVGASNNGPVCVGDSITLSSSYVPNAIYVWNGPNTVDVEGQEIKILAVAGQYSVTVLTPTGCDNSGSTTVVVNSAPEITALSNDSEMCMDGNTPITFYPTVFPPDGNYTYDWVGPNFTSNEENPTIPDASESDNGTYTLTVYNNGCPSQTVSNTIEIHNFPETPDLIGPDNICVGDDLFLFTLTDDPNASYEWHTPKGIFTTSVDTFKIMDIDLSDAGNYDLYIVKNGCKALVASTVQVEVIANPTSPNITGVQTYCFGSTIKLAIEGEMEDDILHWTTPVGTFDMDTLIIDNINQSHAGNYQVILERNGCRSIASVSYNIEVLEEIKIPEFEFIELDLCSGYDEMVEICLTNNSLISSGNYELFNQSGQLISSTNEKCFSINPQLSLSTGANLLRVRTQLGECYSEFSSNLLVNLNIAPNVVAQANENLITLCENTTVNLQATNASSDVQVAWKNINSNCTISNPKGISTSVSNFRLGENYLLLSYSSEGCTDFTTDTVLVYLYESPELENDYYNVEYGENVNLDILENDNIEDDVDLNFDLNELVGRVILQNDGYVYLPDPTHTGIIEFYYEACLKECPDICSEALVRINISSDNACIIPNVITPNNDGINDNFVIPCLDDIRFSDNSIKIFNQWGDEVFSAKDYQNNWDGTYGAKPLPSGTYFYIVEIKALSETMSGYLIIKR
ncbi:MAG TPA: gliding motility-associated C-terminal domain-containing protein [Saprospiraceae bacterium]|nr:gliding motility-associated C-terminal domain-containing protein [Saprospiraceae bacterium]